MSYHLLKNNHVHGKYFLLMIACFILITSAKSQQPYSLIHYDETILPQTSIGNIQQDKNGYLWMNTQYGIVRFDGKEFKNFTTDNTKGLTSNRIRLCAMDDKRDVYFLDENLNVLKVNSPNGFKVKTDEELNRASTYVVWSTSSGSDITLLNFKSRPAYQQFVKLLGIDQKKEMLKCYATGPMQGYFFYADTSNKTRLCYYNGNSYSTELLDSSFHAGNTFALGNQVYQQTSASSAVVFEGVNQTKRIQVTGLPASANRFFIDKSEVLFSNHSGTFLYAEGKLYQYEFHDSIITAKLLFENLPCNSVNNIMKEQTTGDVFISTKNSGIYRVKQNQFTVVDFNIKEKDTVERTGIANTNIVYAIAFWNRNNIFSGGYITSLASKRAATAVAPLFNPLFNLYFLGREDSSHLFMEQNFSLVSFDTKNNTYKPLAKTFHPLKILSLNNGSRLLITNHQVQFLSDKGTEIISSNDTSTLTTAEKISENCLLVGAAKGLFYFFIKERKWQPVPHSHSLKVRYILKDNHDRVWLTTYGQGLYFISGNKLIPMPLDNAGYLSIAHCIAEDNNGNFWVPTNHGLFKIRYNSLLSIIAQQNSKLYYTYFDKTDGFNTNEFNGGCSPAYLYQQETRRLFFPSMDGVVTFNPDSVKTITTKSQVVFDDIIVNDSTLVHPGTSSSTFSNNTTSLRISFSSPYFGHDANIKFSYYLSNHPQEWKDLQNNRSILFNNLPGGSYILSLKKEEASGAPVIATLHFEIEKKFSETVLFKILVVLLVIAIVYLFFRARIIYLSQERTRLEKEVAARTADQQQLINKLNINIETLTQLQAELSQMIAHKENIIAVLIHDIKSPLHFLNTVANHLNKTIAINPAIKNQEIVKEISGSLNQLYLFAQDYTLWLNATNEQRIRKEKISLKKMFTEIKNIYKEGLDKKNINLQIHINNNDFIITDEPMLKSIVRNLVDNAIKHTINGNIRIETNLHNHSFTMQVTDEGKGMTAEQIAELNEYFASKEESLSFASGQFGHKIIKDFLQKLHGNIQYENNNPSGIKAILTLPLITKSV